MAKDSCRRAQNNPMLEMPMPQTSKSADPINVFELPHADIRQSLTGGAPVYLTVNPVEYHGPHLSLHNDLLLSRGTILELHRKWSERFDAPLLVASDLEMGVGPTKGPGTRAVSFKDLCHHVMNAAISLKELGAQRVVIMTFHGDPFHNLAIEQAVAWLNDNGVAALAPFHVLMREMLTVDPRKYAAAFNHVADPAERDRLIAALPTDFHAGFFETSLSLHYCEHTVAKNYTDLPPCPAFAPNQALQTAAKAARALGQLELSRELEFAAIGTGWHTVKPFPGYTGSPHLATKKAGALFAEALNDKFYNAMCEVFERQAARPVPIMRWLPTVFSPPASA